MRKILVYFLGLIILLSSFYTANAKECDGQDKISGGYFSIYLPSSLKGTYSINKKDKGIFIYEKESKKAGFGGFAFGMKAYKNPADHAMMPGARKIGELIDKKNTVYDMVLIQPTDVQFDYTKGESKSYMALYKLAENVDITAGKRTKYIKNGGMKGEDLYKDILNKHIKAVKGKWSAEKLEQENMSYMYAQLVETNKKPLDKIGYVYFDVNGDGIEELLIGEISTGNWKGVIYDIYTMKDRKPVHVASGGSRNRYFVCDDGFLCNEYSQGAGESGIMVYNLVENSTELFLQVAFKYDYYTNKNNPWFISYNVDEEKWDNVSQKVFDERLKTFSKYVRFDYTPLSKVK